MKTASHYDKALKHFQYPALYRLNATCQFGENNSLVDQKKKTTFVLTYASLMLETSKLKWAKATDKNCYSLLQVNCCMYMSYFGKCIFSAENLRNVQRQFRKW